MSTWGSPERFLAVGGDAERRGRSDELVREITDALASAGVYEARIDAQTTQRVVDFNWSARQAGRRLGISVHVDIRHFRTEAEGEAEARVTPLNPPN